MYKKAGIHDVKRFYAERFVELPPSVKKYPLWYFNIRFAKPLWVFYNVRPNSTVLDFGCGTGPIGILKRKGCRIIGIDYSATALEIAKKINNYDDTFCGSIFDFDHPKERFDYIVSLDVFGHIPFEEKDSTIAHLKRFLKPEGTMIHGIECANMDYGKLTQEELKKFIEIDGHVGLEGKSRIIERFKKFFRYVEGELRFTIENSAEEYLKLARQYSSTIGRGINEELIDYLESLTEEAEMAFDIANGLVHLNLLKQDISSPSSKGGFLYLRASDRPLERPDFASLRMLQGFEVSILEDVRVFSQGWYGLEESSGRIFRWNRGEGLIHLREIKGDLSLRIFTHFPEIEARAMNVFFIDEKTKRLIDKIELKDHREHTMVLKTGGLERLDLGIYADIT
jgi:ubiquinone/menaquinone biosynthesis C-methylase UbiE